MLDPSSSSPGSAEVQTSDSAIKFPDISNTGTIRSRARCADRGEGASSSRWSTQASHQVRRSLHIAPRKSFLFDSSLQLAEAASNQGECNASTTSCSASSTYVRASRRSSLTQQTYRAASLSLPLLLLGASLLPSPAAGIASASAIGIAAASSTSPSSSSTAATTSHLPRRAVVWRDRVLDAITGSRGGESGTRSKIPIGYKSTSAVMSGLDSWLTSFTRAGNGDKSSFPSSWTYAPRDLLHHLAQRASWIVGSGADTGVDEEIRMQRFLRMVGVLVGAAFGKSTKFRTLACLRSSAALWLQKRVGASWAEAMDA